MSAVAVRLPAVSSSRHFFFFLAAVAMMMASIDSTIVAVALPQLTTALDAPLIYVGWTITGNQLIQMEMLPLAGKLSDTLGRKKVFLFCIVAFTVGSLLCGLAPNIGALIFFRVLQAIGGGGLQPAGVGMISDLYRDRRAQAIGMFTGIGPLGAIIGPNLGGFILQNWTWRDVFFINIPIGIAAFVGIYLLVNESRKGSGQKLHVDFKGLGLYGGSIVALMYGMTVIGEDSGNWQNPLVLGLILASIVGMAAFVRHTRVAEDPIIDYRLLAKPPFLAANLYNFFFGAAAFGFFAFVPYYGVVRYGLSTLESGAILTPRALAMVATSTLASLYIIRLGYRIPMLVGMACVDLTLLLLGQGSTSVQLGGLTITGFWLLSGIICLSGIGMGLANPSSSNASLDLAPGNAAALTGIRQMFRLTGGVLSIAAIVLALSYFPDKAQGVAVIYLILAGILLITVPLSLMIPDSARERRLQGTTEPKEVQAAAMAEAEAELIEA